MLLDIDTVAYTHALYTLDVEKHRAAIRCTNPLDWIEWMKSHPTEIARTPLPHHRELVTMFAGYAGERHESRPYTFCTMIKPEPHLPEFAVMLGWYATWNEAQEGHRKILARYTQLKKDDGAFNAMMRKRG